MVFLKSNTKKNTVSKRTRFPENIKSYLSEISFKNKIKWYKDEALSKYTYEAKTHHNNLNFSIEFDSLGIIEDVEFKIEWKNIPELIKKNIEFYLDSIYKKKKIIKVQIQYTGKPESLINILKDLNQNQKIKKEI